MHAYLYSLDPHRLAAMVRALEAGGLSIQGESDGARMVAQLSSQPVPLLVADAGTQDPSGEHFAAAWAGTHILGVPVLLLVERLDASQVGRLFASGVMDIVEQPVTMGALRDRVVAALAAPVPPRLQPPAVSPHALTLLLRFLERTQRSGTLVVETQAGPAQLLIHEGRVSAARLEGLPGDTVLEWLAAQPVLGMFHFQPAPQPQAHAVAAPQEPPRSVLPPSQPATPGALRADAVLPIPPNWPGKVPAPRALVVDDDPALLEIACRFLERAGLEVSRATSGGPGMEMALKVRPHVLVSDIMMPDVDGWALLRMVRDDHRVREIPFLLLSCHDEYRDKLAQVGAGADAYLAKGIKGDQLTRVVLDAAQRHREAWALAGPHVRLEGGLDQVGALNLLRALAFHRVSGTLRAQNGFIHAAVALRDGGLAGVVVESGHGTVSGPEALWAYASMSGATFVFDPREAPPDGQSWDMEGALEQACVAANAADEAVRDQLLVGGASLDVNPDMLKLYEQVCAHVSGPVLAALAGGRSAAETMVETGESPLLVEWVVKDMVRKGVAVFRPPH